MTFYCRKVGFNIVTFDYRGFGDSVPSLETNTVTRALEDVAAVTSWSLESGMGNVIIWGHSLGSALAVQFLSSAPALATCGLVLMSPFNNLQVGGIYELKIAADKFSKLFNVSFRRNIQVHFT